MMLTTTGRKANTKLTIAVIAASAICAALAACSSAEPVGAAKRARYLVLDARIINKTENVELTVGVVDKHPANPLFKEDKPGSRASTTHIAASYTTPKRKYGNAGTASSPAPGRAATSPARASRRKNAPG